jgi:hypothetical protein
MFNKLAAAVIAVSLIAGPVLAQGASNAPATSTSQPTAKADVKKITTNKHVTKVKNTKHHASKAVKHVKHVKHIKHVRHVKHSAKSKTAG